MKHEADCVAENYQKICTVSERLNTDAAILTVYIVASLNIAGVVGGFWHREIIWSQNTASTV